MAESLRHHVQEGEELQKQNKILMNANRQLIEEKDLHNVIVKEKILQAKAQAQEVAYEISKKKKKKVFKNFF